MMFRCCFANIFVYTLIGFTATVLLLRWFITRRVKKSCRAGIKENTVTVGFFHPYCNAGGGGERVLWTGINAVLNKYPNAQVIVYTGDTAVPVEILIKVQDQFNIKINSQRVKFVYLLSRAWVEADLYPFLTLLGQSLGSILLGMEALFKYVPDIYLDTMGYAFTVPLFRYIGGCQVGCYVHYPTISTDMLQQVSSRVLAHNNRGYIAASTVFSYAKIIYYYLFAIAYGVAGRCSHTVMVNSSWTKGHIVSLWGKSSNRPIFLVYPPCDVEEFESTEHKDERRTKNIVSVSQFRPEKDHALQLKSFSILMKNLPLQERDTVKLILIGSCRDIHDSNRVESLKELCRELNIADYVQFEENISFDKLKQHLERATIGLHTMWNEHFGIGVVECMAAGLIMLAHNSGGPKMDIVVEYDGNPTGFLASSEEEYATQMLHILNLPSDQLEAIRQNARKSIQRFKAPVFCDRFLQAIEPLFLTCMD